jgi:hypothetical protein
MRQRHARGQEHVCGLADVLRTLEERDEARAEVERLKAHFILIAQACGNEDPDTAHHAVRARVAERDAAVAKAAAYERDWYDAKSEFGTATAKLRERVRVVERERDEARAEVESAQRHRDGLARSLAAATAERDSLRAEVARLRARAEYAERELVEERARPMLAEAERLARSEGPSQLALFGGPQEARRAPPAPVPAPRPPAPVSAQAAARDAALDALEEHRAEVIELARGVARTLALQHGRVTSSGVLQAMRDQGMGDEIDAVDRRFMGCVFRGRGWQQIGWETSGSHRRRQPVWALRVPTR